MLQKICLKKNVGEKHRKTALGTGDAQIVLARVRCCVVVKFLLEIWLGGALRVSEINQKVWAYRIVRKVRERRVQPSSHEDGPHVGMLRGKNPL